MYVCMYVCMHACVCMYVCSIIYVLVCRYVCVCCLFFVSVLFVPGAQHSTAHFIFYAALCQMRQQPGRGLCEAHNDAACRRAACCWIRRIRTCKFRPPISQLLRIQYLPPLNGSLTLLLLFYHLNTKEALAAN